MSGKEKKSKNQLRRERAKLKKLQEPDTNGSHGTGSDGAVPDKLSEPISRPSKLLQSLELEPTDIPEEYRNILNKFALDESTGKAAEDAEKMMFSDDDVDTDDADTHGDQDQGQDQSKSKNADESHAAHAGSNGFSKRQLRKANKISLAQLKAKALRPEVVDWYDADAPEPELLVEIKSTPGIVPVPDHWQHKREYLSSRRIFRKAPFDLPDYIKDTGIMEMRDALKDDERTLQQKTRERVQPKMGKMDLDYQKLHNAFFKFQTKPRLFHFAELYHENKDEEVDLSPYRPGKLSERLKHALNIPPGAPPPWLLMMQRYGPPPSYPDLKIPGLNAPIPPGSQWGFHPGGYGKPPLDGDGKPLFGDVYGDENSMKIVKKQSESLTKTIWGQMIDDYGESEEEDDEDDEGSEGEGPGQIGYEEGNGYVDEDAAAAADANAQQTVELRKAKRKRTEHEDPEENDQDMYNSEIPEDEKPSVVDAPETAPAYKVLEQRSESGGFLGTHTVYNMPSEQDDIQSTIEQLLAQGARDAKK